MATPGPLHEAQLRSASGSGDVGIGLATRAHGRRPSFGSQRPLSAAATLYTGARPSRHTGGDGARQDLGTTAIAASDAPPAAPGRGPVPVPKVVYILGTGRCGSTVLDIMLGAHPDICSTGELHRLPTVATGASQPCSCGADASACEFWGRVIADVERQFPLAELQAGRRFEFTRSLPRTALGLAVPGSAVDRFADRLGVLMQAIARQSGRPIVVDSSKHSSRGLILWHARRAGIDVRFVHLVRDGRGFVWSKRRVLDGQGLGLTVPEKSVADLSAWWVVSNVLSGLLFRLHPGRYLRLRYEDLVADPEATLAKIGKFVGVDLRPVAQSLRDGTPLAVGHVVGGNRLRFARTLVLRPDTDWQQNMPRADERTFWSIAGWLARRYGYSVREATPPVDPTGSRTAGT